MFSYDPLPANCIRIAEIHPAQFEDDLEISLHPRPFAPTALPRPVVPYYEALSYTWGAKDNPGIVHIRGTSDAGTSTIEITRNLDIALRHLRYADQPRNMWIDAICIDQSNDVEKGPQVAIMGDLYQLAERVVVWLGPAENDSDNAMRLMEAIGAEVYVDFDKCEMVSTPTATEPSFADEGETIPLGEDDLCALHHLLCRTWFERLWIRQEISLANEDAIVVCGARLVPWPVFRAAWACFYLKPKMQFKYSHELTERNNSLSGLLFQDVGNHLPYLRQSFGNAKCSDARDRIYAVLSLDEIATELGIVPSYSISAAELYEDVATRILDRFRDLGILTECEMPDGDGGIGTPSWVPDWSVGNSYAIHLSVGVNYASGPLVGPNSLEEGHLLRVVGVSVDTIRSLDRHRVVRKSVIPGASDTIEAVKQILSGRNLSAEYVGGRTLLDAGGGRGAGGRGAGAYSPATTFPSMMAARLVLRNLALPDETSSPPSESEAEEFIDRLEDVLRGRLILETARHYLGLAPPSTLPGDEICVVLGCSLPMVLRPLGADGHYQVIGPCYVCGLNDGEAVLGPLPRGVRFGQVWNGEGYDEGFMNDETGQVSDDDPRLREWPVEGLTRFRAGSEGKAGERLLVDVNYLKDRGIAATYFNLV